MEPEPDPSPPQAARTIRVALVEDDDGVRENLAALINSSTGFVCLGEFRTAELALSELPKIKPDVVIMDIHLPEMDGIQCVRQLKQEAPAIQIMMLTVYEDVDQILEALKAGANGYLIKSTPPNELLDAIADVHDGGGPMSSNVARKVIASFRQEPDLSPALAHLTKRELEVLERLARGFTYKEIAQHLDVTYETIHTHLGRIYQKLQVRTRTEAVFKYLRPRQE